MPREPHRVEGPETPREQAERHRRAALESGQEVLRDRFAAAALTGLLARMSHGGEPTHCAKVAYEVADEMMVARATRR